MRLPATSDDRLAAGLATLLLTAGTLHFVTPEPFDSIVPESIPGTPRSATYLSGVAEIGIGAALLAPATRRVAGGAAAALFIGVFPANITMAYRWRHRPLPQRAIALGRLPLQAPLVWAALRVRRGTPQRKAR